MKKLFGSACLLLFAVMLAGCGGGGGSSSGAAPAATTTGYSLSGRVVVPYGKIQYPLTTGGQGYFTITVPIYSLSGVSINFGGTAATSSSSGQFSFSNLSCGTNYVVSFSSPSIISSNQDYMTCQNSAHDFPVSLTSAYLGRLNVSSNLGGAKVYINNTQMMIGEYPVTEPMLIEDMPVGTYSLYLVQQGYAQTASQTVTITAGQQSNLSFTLTAL